MGKFNCTCGKCRLDSTQSSFVLKGKSTNSYRLKNKDRLVISESIVDDCLLSKKTEDEKCDFLYTCESLQKTIFVEIKGSDILKAVKQISKSISLLKNEIRGYDISARIIPTRVHSPDIKSSKYIALQQQLNNKIITKSFIEESIN